MNWKKWLHSFWMIIRHRDPEISEVIVATLMIWWGAWHMLPLQYVFDYTIFFSQLEEIASEEAWGLLSLVIGSSMLNAVIINDISNRKRMTFIACVVWMGCASASISASEMEPLVFYSFFSIISGWNYYRLWTH